MAFRTLGDLRAELLARIGMGGMGASGGANGALMDSFLRNGQFQLYRDADWRHLTDYNDITTGVGQNLYDYPVAGVMNTAIGCARDKRVLRLETNISGQFVEIKEGISTDMWSTMDTQSNPARYERFTQILIYPKSNQAYTLRVWFISDLAQFTQAQHVATLDDEMILLHAVAHAKAHYRQPDAKLYADDLAALRASLRGQSFGQNGVYRRSEQTPVERKPALLGRDA
jgi:hypothetical protein